MTAAFLMGALLFVQSAGPPAESADERNARLLQRFQDLVDQARKFEDVSVQATTLADLADRLLDHDPAGALQCFLEAYNLARAQRPTSPQSSPDEAREAARRDRFNVSLRRRIIAKLARRSPQEARRLADREAADEKLSEANRAEFHLDAALDLLEVSPSEAVRFAEQSLRNGVSPVMIAFLENLRRSDEAAADRLFLATVAKLAAQPDPDVNDLLMLGTYVFTSPSIDPNDLDLRGAVEMTVVGTHMVVNLTGNRIGASPDAVRAYLQAAIGILSRSVADSRRKQLYYIAAYQLLPAVRQFVPESAASLALVMQSLAPDVPPALTQPAAYANLARIEPREADDSLKVIEEIGDEVRREGRYLSLAFDEWRRKRPESALRIAAKMKDEAARAAVKTMVEFTRAAAALEGGDLAGAEEMTAGMDAGLERAVLYLAIGRTRQQRGDSSQAREAYMAVVQEARRLSGGHGALLLLAASSQQAEADPIGAAALFGEALQEFNKLSPEDFYQTRWHRYVEAGKTWRHFPLKVKNLEVDFLANLSRYMAADLDGALHQIATLQPEFLRGQALVAAGSILLAKVKRKPSPASRAPARRI